MGVLRAFYRWFKEFPKGFKRVSRGFQGGFKRVSRKFQGCFVKILLVFQECFRGSSRKIHVSGCLKVVLFMTVCFKEVTRCSMKN